MTDPVALAIVGAVSTAAAAIIAGVFKMIELARVSKDAAAASKQASADSKQAVVESQKAVVAVVAASPEPEKVHAAISEFDALRAATAESRAAAAARLESLTRES
jgi:hypothetical protein